MIVLALPPDIEAWATAEVAAGRGESVEAVATRLLRGAVQRRRQVAALVEEAVAEGDRAGWLSDEAAFAEMDELIGELDAAAEAARGEAAQSWAFTSRTP